MLMEWWTNFIVMLPLEQLGLVVSFYQACGVIPYTMECDPETRKFTRFKFSFKHFTTWWFIILIVWQLACSFLIFAQEKNFMSDVTSDSPVTVIILVVTLSFLFFSQNLVFRWMMLFCNNRLQSALRKAQLVEKLIFLSDFHLATKSSFVGRFVFGFIVIIISVSYCLCIGYDKRNIFTG